MYRKPSWRRRKGRMAAKPNLIPIMDATFIFIFFLLTSANFLKIAEVGSDVPIISESAPPPTKEKPLALTIKIVATGIQVMVGVPSNIYKTIPKNSLGYDLDTLHTLLVTLKKQNPAEETVIFEPIVNISYEELVKIMDSVRMMQNTDEPIYKTGKDGMPTKVDSLFNKIIFANLMS